MLSTKFFLCAMLVVVATFMEDGAEPDWAPPKDPEVPWKGDPDLSKVADEQVLKLWEDTVVTYRRKTNSGSANGIHFGEDYRSQRLHDEDQAHLLKMLEQEIKKASVNWEYVFTMLLIMTAGMDQTSTIPELANFLFTMPRPMKMSWSHGMSYKTMLALLGYQHTDESAALLYAATHEAYWGDDPLFSPILSKRSREESLDCLRGWALCGLAEMRPNICLPWLEKLSEDYPFKNVDKKRLALMYAGVMDTDLSIGKLVESYLRRIKAEMESIESEPKASETE